MKKKPPDWKKIMMAEQQLATVERLAYYARCNLNRVLEEEFGKPKYSLRDPHGPGGNK